MPDAAEELLAVLFRASIAPEEGATVRSAFAIVHPELPCSVEMERTSLTASWVRKFGGAFRPSDLVVALTEKLEIRGLLERQFVDSFLPVAHGLGPHCWAEVRGVGQVALGLGDARGLFRREKITASNYQERYAFTVPKAAVRQAANALNRSSTERARIWNEARKTPTHWRVRTDQLEAIAEGGIKSALETLAHEVREGLRGGGLLVVPDSAHDAFVTAAPTRASFSPRTSLKAALPWDWGFVEGFTIATLDPGGESPHPPNLILPWLEDLLTVSRAKTAQLQRVAQLCHVDGATVVSPTFFPIAIGAKLTGFLRSELPVQVESWLAERHAGMRHRSMATAVANIRGSIGLVVSEDGDATVFSHGDESVQAPFEITT